MPTEALNGADERAEGVGGGAGEERPRLRRSAARGRGRGRRRGRAGRSGRAAAGAAAGASSGRRMSSASASKRRRGGAEEPPPGGPAVAEAGGGLLDRAQHRRRLAAVERMREVDLRPGPLEPVAVEAERRQRRRADRDRVDGRAVVVQQAGQGQLAGAGAAADRLGGLDHRHPDPAGAQRRGAGQPVGAGADDHRLAHAAVGLTPRHAPMRADLNREGLSRRARAGARSCRRRRPCPPRPGRRRRRRSGSAAAARGRAGTRPASSITPSCSHTARAPISIASSTCAPASEERRKTSTTSTGSPMSCTLAKQRSPRISDAAGLTGITRKPRRCSSAAIRCESRAGSGEQPTTAHVRVSSSAKRTSPSIRSRPGCVLLHLEADDRAFLQAVVELPSQAMRWACQ